MKEYPIEYQYGMSIRFFLIDSNNQLALFDSLGSILPKNVAMDAEGNEKLGAFFSDSALPKVSYIPNPHLEKCYHPCLWQLTKEKKHNWSIENVIAEYSPFASIGLWTFEKTDGYTASNDISYHLISSPTMSIDVSKLPESIRMVLESKRVNFNFSDFTQLNCTFQPWASLFDRFYYKPLYEYRESEKGLLENLWDMFK